MSADNEKARHAAELALVGPSDAVLAAAADRFLFVAALHDAGGCSRLEYLRARKRWRGAYNAWRTGINPPPAPAGPATIYNFEDYKARWRGPNRGFC